MFFLIEKPCFFQVSFLLSHGAAVNIADALGRCPAHIAAERGFLSCLEILLHVGASLELKDVHGQTVLNSAVTENQTDIASLLIDQGADVHTIGENGFSLLHKATLRVSHSIYNFFNSKDSIVLKNCDKIIK